MTPVAINITVERGVDGHIWFEALANVANPSSIDLTGSTFELDVVDLVGVSVLSLSVGTPADGIIRFDLTPDQTASLPSGQGSRYTLLRLSDGVREAWATGVITAQGIVGNG
jgi:hypothetical protein